MTLHNQLNFLLTWNSSQQEQTLKSYTHPCFRWSWLPQRCTFSKLSWKVWVQMRVTQRIICCWRKVFSTQSGTAANCSSWSKGSLFTCLALKWGVVQAHMELSCPFGSGEFGCLQRGCWLAGGAINKKGYTLSVFFPNGVGKIGYPTVL